MVTKAGLAKMEEELIQLKGPEMKKVMSALAEARDKGDISESAEYEMAREHLGILTLKIQTLQERVNNSVLAHKTECDGTVQLFTNVTLLNKKTKKELVFSIVTDDDIDVKSGKISHNSPIAKGLIGHSKGETVKITVPNGVMEFDILNVE